MVSSAKQKLNASRHAWNKDSSKRLVKADKSTKESTQLSREYLEMAASYPLHLAAMQGDPSGIKRLLSEGVDINRLDTENRTPLMLAALFGCRANLSCLLEHDASTNKKDVFGQKALDYAQPCKCNDKKRNETYRWNTLDNTHLALECRIIVNMLKGNQKRHTCPSRPEKLSDYYSVRPGKNTFTIMAPVFQITVNNAENRTIAWTLRKGTLDVHACAVSGWSFTKYKNPPEFLLDSEEWTDKVVTLSRLVEHDLHGGNHDHGEYGRMFSSHAEKQIIAYIAWELMLEALSSNSIRSWERSHQAKIGDEIEIFVSRIPCRWCYELCEKTNSKYGTNIKLVFIHRVQNLADRCKCGGCMCEIPRPQVIIPMLENLADESPIPSPPRTSTRQSKQKANKETQIQQDVEITALISKPIRHKHKQIAAAASLPTPETSPRTPQKQLPAKTKKASSHKQIQEPESSETEVDDDWVAVDTPPTPSRKSQETDVPSRALIYSSTKKPTTPNAKPLSLDSDNDFEDFDEWEPPSSLKRSLTKSSSKDTLETPSPKRQRLDISKSSSTGKMSRKVGQHSSPSSVPFAKWMCDQATTSPTETKSAKATPLRTNSLKASPLKANPMKKSARDSPMEALKALMASTVEESSMAKSPAKPVSVEKSHLKTSSLAKSAAKTNVGSARSMAGVEKPSIKKPKRKPGRPRKSVSLSNESWTSRGEFDLANSWDLSFTELLERDGIDA